MSDFLLNLAKRVEPTFDLRPRISARFESENEVNDFAIQDVAEPSRENSVDSPPKFRDSQTDKNLSNQPGQLTEHKKDHVDLAISTEEAPKFSRESSTPATVDDASSSISTIETSEPTEFEDRMSELRQMIFDVQSRIRSGEDSRERPLPNQIITREHETETIVEVVGEASQSMSTDRSIPITQPESIQQRRPTNPNSETVQVTEELLREVRQPSVEAQLSKGATETHSAPEKDHQTDVKALAQRPVSKLREKSGRARQALQSDHKPTTKKSFVPQVAPEKTANQRAEETSRASQRIVNVTIGKVEVKAINNRPSTTSNVPDGKRPTAVMSLDEYVRQRSIGGLT